EQATSRLVESLFLAPQPALQIEALRSARGLARDGSLKESLAKLAEQFKDLGPQPSRERRELIDQLLLAYAGTTGGPPLHLIGTARPKGTPAWEERLQSGGDAEAGRRIFFHSRSAGCYKCHTVQGRGGRIGPDLSLVAR